MKRVEVLAPGTGGLATEAGSEMQFPRVMAELFQMGTRSATESPILAAGYILASSQRSVLIIRR